MDFLNEEIKKDIDSVVFSARKKRKNFFNENKINAADYKEGMTEIRKKVFDDFENNLEIAKENFRKNGFTVKEAKNSKEALNILKESISGFDNIIKTKTNTGNEIGLDEFFKKENIKISETDLGDFLVNLFKEEDLHYVLPALHIKPEEISDKIKEKWGAEIEPDPEKLTRFLSEKIRKNILEADLGITGANFFTKKGQVVLLENEGNISLASRVPSKHIIICGIDKLVSGAKDAIDLCQTAALFGTGQKITQYISVISGPSKTADIQNVLVEGAQGAKEVEVILLDNGRRQALEDGFEDVLRCINCGSCINFCPVYRNLGVKYGGNYIGSKGIVMEFLNNFSENEKRLELAKKAGSFKCTLCAACKENCPMQIDLPKMVKKIREIQSNDNFQTKENDEMVDKIKKHGNPFGSEAKKETPDKLYCC